MAHFVKIIRNIVVIAVLAGGALTAYTKYTADTSSNIISNAIPEEISTEITDSISEGIVNGISNGIKSAGDYADDYIKGKFSADETPDYELTQDNMFNASYDIVSGDIAKCAIECPIEDIQSDMSLDIDMGGCSFKIAASGDSSFYIEASNIGKCQYYIEADTLFIKGYGADSGVKNEIIFYIPKGYAFAAADIELGAGNIEIESIEADKLKLKCGVGLINAEYAEAESINLKCSAGSINVRLFGVKEDYDYILESAIGMVTIADETYSGVAQSQKILNDSDKNVDINCTMGNIKISF